MLNNVILFFFLTFSHSLFPAQKATLSKDDFARFSAFLAGISSIEAEFSQKVFQKDKKAVKSSSSKLFFEKSNKNLYLFTTEASGSKFEIIKRNNVAVFNDLLIKQTTYMSSDQIKALDINFSFDISYLGDIPTCTQKGDLLEVCAPVAFKDVKKRSAEICFIFQDLSFTALKGMILKDDFIISTILFKKIDINGHMPDDIFEIKDYKLLDK